jgi:hypothetical protein
MSGTEDGSFRDNNLVSNLYVVGMDDDSGTNVAIASHLEGASIDGGEMPNPAIVADGEFVFAYDDGAPGEFHMSSDVVSLQSVQDFLQTAG